MHSELILEILAPTMLANQQLGQLVSEALTEDSVRLWSQAKGTDLPVRKPGAVPDLAALCDAALRGSANQLEAHLEIVLRFEEPEEVVKTVIKTLVDAQLPKHKLEQAQDLAVFLIASSQRALHLARALVEHLRRPDEQASATTGLSMVAVDALLLAKDLDVDISSLVHDLPPSVQTVLTDLL